MKKAALAIALVLAIVAPAGAHHSRSNFQLDKELSFPAVVTKFEYTNPHSYLYAKRTDDAAKDEEWVVELGSVPNLARMNMGRDSLKPGDKIFVKGNPDRDPKKHYMFLGSITRADGVRYAMADVFAAGAKARASGEGKPGSKDFAGIWALDFGPNPGAVLTGPAKRPDLPVNEAGKAMLAKFNPDEDPWFFCEAIGVPRIVNSPYALIIKREKNLVHLDYEFSPLNRVVHMNETTAPAVTKPSLMGYSIGRMEGSTLVIETSNFTPEKWGLSPGLDSSAQKTVVERYALAEDGHAMSVAVTTSDPAYLTKPIENTFKWRYAPGYEVTPYVECNKDAAAKHIEIEHKKD